MPISHHKHGQDKTKQRCPVITSNSCIFHIALKIKALLGNYLFQHAHTMEASTR